MNVRKDINCSVCTALRIKWNTEKSNKLKVKRSVLWRCAMKAKIINKRFQLFSQRKLILLSSMERLENQGWWIWKQKCKKCNNKLWATSLWLDFWCVQYSKLHHWNDTLWNRTTYFTIHGTALNLHTMFFNSKRDGSMAKTKLKRKSPLFAWCQYGQDQSLWTSKSSSLSYIPWLSNTNNQSSTELPWKHVPIPKNARFQVLGRTKFSYQQQLDILNWMVAVP